MDQVPWPVKGQYPPPAQQANSTGYVTNPLAQAQQANYGTHALSQARPSNWAEDFFLWQAVNQPENFFDPQAQPANQPDFLGGYIGPEFWDTNQATTVGPPPSAQQTFQQPLPQATQHSHPPTLTFEQRKGVFRPTPLPRPNPVPRPGQGRKKKDRPFWAPADADAHLRSKHEELYTAHTRVCGAEKKLANCTNPAKIEHYQNIVVRNMEIRENLRYECERMENGQGFATLTVQEAYQKTKQLSKKLSERLSSVAKNGDKLSNKYPGIIGPDGVLDRKRLNKEDRESLDSTLNWYNHYHRKLTESFSDLFLALERVPNGGNTAAATLVATFHDLGCYQAGARWLWPGRPDLQMQHSNPEDYPLPLRSEAEPPLPQAGYQAQPEKSWAQHYQEVQPAGIDLTPFLPQENLEAHGWFDQAWNSGAQVAQNQQLEEAQWQEQNHDTEMTEPDALKEGELDAEHDSDPEETPFQAPVEERPEASHSDASNIDPSLRTTRAPINVDQEAAPAGDQSTAPPEEHEHSVEWNLKGFGHSLEWNPKEFENVFLDMGSSTFYQNADGMGFAPLTDKEIAESLGEVFRGNAA